MQVTFLARYEIHKAAVLEEVVAIVYWHIDWSIEAEGR